MRRLGQKISEVSLRLLIDFTVFCLRHHLQNFCCMGVQNAVPLWEVQVACVLLKWYFWTGISHALKKKGNNFLKFFSECALPLVSPVLLHSFYSSNFTISSVNADNARAIRKQNNLKKSCLIEGEFPYNN